MASDIYYHPTHVLFKDLTGKRFGRLIALGVVAKRLRLGQRSSSYLWLCKCDCGKVTTTDRGGLTAGSSTSCGCRSVDRLVTHGRSGTRIYRIWLGIKSRCYKKTCNTYKNYGGRGIKVCRRWNDFVNFLEDMGPCQRWEEIDRIDVNGDYEPGNCRWTTRKVNANNRRNNVLVTHNGVTMTLAQWADKTGIHPKTLGYRIHTSNMTTEEALTREVKTTYRK